MFARQLAWMHSRPETLKGKTRADNIKDRGGNPLFPTLGPCFYISAWWLDLGMVAAGYGKPQQLSAQEIQSWAHMSCTKLNHWEFHVLRRMSAEYLSQAALANDENCAPPHGDPMKMFDRKKVETKVKNAFAAFAKAKK